VQRFTELAVWQRGHLLVVEIYRATESFPRGELFGLVSQLRRAAVSVTANIAEGSKRRSSRDYAHMLNLAEGSLAEVECLLMLSRDLAFLPVDRYDRLAAAATEVAAMLSGLRKKVEAPK
jgi:four helix bundle protein